VRILLDESGQQSETLPLMVGAVACPEPERLDDILNELHAELSAMDRFAGQASFDAFVKDGFHNWQIPFELQVQFISELEKLDGFRLYVCFSRRARLPTLTDDQRCLVLYRALLPDVYLAQKIDSVDLWFEENSTLGRHFKKVAEDSRADAVAKSDEDRVPQVNVRVVSKDEAPSLGIVDFAMAIIGQWLLQPAPRDLAQYKVRNFMAIERDVALIHDFDSGKRSTRLHRDFA
jgi:hypothetical protein